MSTLRDPVGPKDRKVYIRRRLFVLLGLVAVVAVVVLVFVKPGSSGGAKDAQQVNVPSDLATSEPADDEGDEQDKGPAACSAGQLKVTPVTDKGSYAEGEIPLLSLSIENTGKESCAADLGTAGMEFTVTSGDDQVWRSIDCQKNPQSLAVEIEPGKPLESDPIKWDRTRSSPETCDITRDPVTAGGASYHLRVKAGGVDGEGTAQFMLQ